MGTENHGLELLTLDQKGYFQRIVNILNDNGFAVLNYDHGFEATDKGEFRSTGIVSLKIAPAFMVH